MRLDVSIFINNWEISISACYYLASVLAPFTGVLAPFFSANNFCVLAPFISANKFKFLSIMFPFWVLQRNQFFLKLSHIT